MVMAPRAGDEACVEGITRDGAVDSEPSVGVIRGGEDLELLVKCLELRLFDYLV